MKVERFEDLICWQKARVMTNVVYELTRGAEFSRDFELLRQIRAAVISTMSNIAEGFERWSFKEFARFLDIAKGSAGEVRSQLYTALDQRYITSAAFESAVAAVIETSKTIAGLLGHLERRMGSYRVKETGAPDTTSPLDLPREFCDSCPEAATPWGPDPTTTART